MATSKTGKKAATAKRSYVNVFEKARKSRKWQKVTDIWTDSQAHSAANAFYSWTGRRGYFGQVKTNLGQGVLQVKVF